MDKAAATDPAPAPAPARTPGLAPGIGPDGTYTRGGQVAAFVFGLWALVVFFPLLIVGALLYRKAEERFESDPAGARKRVMWSWFCITAGPLLGVGSVVLIYIVAALAILSVAV